MARRRRRREAPPGKEEEERQLLVQRRPPLPDDDAAAAPGVGGGVGVAGWQFNGKYLGLNFNLKNHLSTGLGKRKVPRLLELAPRGQRESGGGIHAT